MKKSKPRKANAARAYLDGLAEASRRTQRQALEVLAELVTGSETPRLDRVAWHRVKWEQAVEIRAAIAARYAVATANRIMAAFRGVLRASWRLGLMTADQFARATDLERVRGSALPRGRALTAAEVERLYAVCAEDPTPAGVRDGAAIALMHAAGLRRAEVVSLDLDAVDLRTGSVTVHGKGRKQRVTYLGAALPWMEAWIDARGQEPGPLLLGVRFRDLVGSRLTENGIYDVVKRRASAASIERCTPHDLRRTFATELLDSGADLNMVRQLLGHASVATTTIYDRRGEDAKARAQRHLTVPSLARRRHG